jgi:hypothetical protein
LSLCLVACARPLRGYAPAALHPRPGAFWPLGTSPSGEDTPGPRRSQAVTDLTEGSLDTGGFRFTPEPCCQGTPATIGQPSPCATGYFMGRTGGAWRPASSVALRLHAGRLLPSGRSVAGRSMTRKRARLRHPSDGGNRGLAGGRVYKACARCFEHLDESRLSLQARVIVSLTCENLGIESLDTEIPSRAWWAEHASAL